MMHERAIGIEVSVLRIDLTVRLLTHLVGEPLDGAAEDGVDVAFAETGKAALIRSENSVGRVVRVSPADRWRPYCRVGEISCSGGGTGARDWSTDERKSQSTRQKTPQRRTKSGNQNGLLS